MNVTYIIFIKVSLFHICKFSVNLGGMDMDLGCHTGLIISWLVLFIINGGGLDTWSECAGNRVDSAQLSPCKITVNVSGMESS